VRDLPQFFPLREPPRGSGYWPGPPSNILKDEVFSIPSTGRAALWLLWHVYFRDLSIKRTGEDFRKVPSQVSCTFFHTGFLSARRMRAAGWFVKKQIGFPIWGAGRNSTVSMRKKMRIKENCVCRCFAVCTRPFFTAWCHSQKVWKAGCGLQRYLFFPVEATAGIIIDLKHFLRRSGNFLNTWLVKNLSVAADLCLPPSFWVNKWMSKSMGRPGRRERVRGAGCRFFNPAPVGCIFRRCSTRAFPLISAW